jgi:hypothetical protein
MVIKLTSLAVSALLLICSLVIFAQEATEEALSSETGDQVTTYPSIIEGSDMTG